MDNSSRQKLQEIVTHRGTLVYHDAKLCKALLKDFCGMYRKEISILLGAVDEGIPAQLLASKPPVSHTVLIAQLINKLQENLALTEEAARWAVESWVYAQGVNYIQARPNSKPKDSSPPKVSLEKYEKFDFLPLHFIWICDCSGSISGRKIQTLNSAIREAIPLMQKEVHENPNAQVLVRAIKFSNSAQWHVGQPTSIEDFKWINLSPDGVTDMGKALSMVAEQLKIPPMTDRALPPVLVLISDGCPTDNFSSGLRQFMEQPWGKKTVRVAISTGGGADYEVLQKFIGHSWVPPLQATNPDALVRCIQWASTLVKTVSLVEMDESMNLPLPPWSLLYGDDIESGFW